MNILEIKGLSHQFSNGAWGLREIDLTIEEGEFVVIAGANGSGKTTLLKHINGLLRPTRGEVLLAGVSVTKNVNKARQMAGMVFQDAESQIIGETVYDDVAFGPENLKLERPDIDDRVGRALRSVELSNFADARPHRLSGGEKRRLAIAGILVMEPSLIMFDEPFSNLDYPGVCQVLKQILSLHRTGRTMLLTTHDLEKVIADATRLIVMENGGIVEDGLPAEIIDRVERYGVRSPCSNRLGKGFISWLN